MRGWKEWFNEQHEIELSSEEEQAIMEFNQEFPIDGPGPVRDDERQLPKDELPF